MTAKPPKVPKQPPEQPNDKDALLAELKSYIDQSVNNMGLSLFGRIDQMEAKLAETTDKRIQESKEALTGQLKEVHDKLDSSMVDNINNLIRENLDPRLLKKVPGQAQAVAKPGEDPSGDSGAGPNLPGNGALVGAFERLLNGVAGMFEKSSVADLASMIQTFKGQSTQEQIKAERMLWLNGLTAGMKLKSGTLTGEELGASLGIIPETGPKT